MEYCDVLLFGEKIGELYYLDYRLIFTYTKTLPYEISPLHLPMNLDRAFDYTDLTNQDGLAGVFSDTLPDHYGEVALKSYFDRRGMEANTIDRLLFLGSKTMGALTYEPSDQNFVVDSITVNTIQGMHDMVKEVVSNTGYYNFDIAQSILKSVSPLGGAKPKALIGFRDLRSPLFAGVRNGELPEGYHNAIIKFNDRRENSDFNALATEYTYMKIAKEIGITIPEIFLSPEGHFIIHRFDNVNGEKLHMHSLQGVMHSNFKVPRTVDYVDAFRVMTLLNVPHSDKEEFYKRMVFNYLFRNHDDHEKNHSYLMDKRGRWRLSPAYDITFAYKKGGEYIGDHQLKFNGMVGDRATGKEFAEIAEMFDISNYKETIAEVKEARETLQEKLDRNRVRKSFSEHLIQKVFERRIEL